MTKNVIIALLSLALVWFGMAIVRLESYHYASMLQMCGPPDLLKSGKREVCLEQAQTRTSAFYQLLYGLKVL